MSDAAAPPLPDGCTDPQFDLAEPTSPTETDRSTHPTMPLDPNTWTIKTQEAVNAALASARERSNPEATPDHLLAALLRQDDGVVLPVVRNLGLTPLTLRDATDRSLEALPTSYGSDTRPSREFLGLFDRGRRRAGRARRRLPVDRAPAAGPRRRRPGAPARRPPVRRDLAGGRAGRTGPGPRLAAGHVAEPRGQVPVAREVRERPHRGGPRRQARPRHRPGRGDPPDHPGPRRVAPRTTRC